MNYLSTILKHADYHLIHYIEYTLPARIREQHKSIVLKYLIKFPELLKTVASSPQWEALAWPIVIKGLSTKQYLPSSWMQMAVKKNSLKGNQALQKYFESRGSVEALKYLTQTSLSSQAIEATVKRMWQSKKLSRSHELDYASFCAVQYGHLDALEHVINLLNPVNNADDYSRGRAREILLRLADTDQDVVSWYEANRARLRFNKKRMKYVVY